MRGEQAAVHTNAPITEPAGDLARGDLPQRAFEWLGCLASTLRVVLFSVLSLLTLPAFAAESAIELRWEAPESGAAPRFVVRYAFEGSDRLRFAAANAPGAAQVRQRTWRNLTPQCASLEPDAVRRLQADCTEARFEISNETVRLDRVYPGVVALGERAALIYLDYLWHERASRLRFWGPEGAVVRVGREVLQLPADVNKPALPSFAALGPGALLQAEREPVLLASELLNPGLLGMVNEVQRRLWATLQTVYGQGLSQPPLLAIHHDPQGTGGRAGMEMCRRAPSFDSASSGRTGLGFAQTLRWQSPSRSLSGMNSSTSCSAACAILRRG